MSVMNQIKVSIILKTALRNHMPYVLTLFLIMISSGVSVSAQQKTQSQTVKPASPETPAKTESKEKAAAEAKKEKQEKFEKDADLKKAEWIEKTMEFGIQKDRRDAINFIPTVKDAGRKKQLEDKLVNMIEKEQDPTVLVKALAIISELKLESAANSVTKKLDHENEDVRIAAVYALKDIKAVQTKVSLIDHLKKQDFTKPSNYTEAMIQTLADFEAREVKDFAIEKISDNKTTMTLRLGLILFLGRAGVVDSKDFLIKSFKDADEDLEIRSYSVNAIARLNFKEAAPDINKVLDEIATYPFAKKKQYNGLQMYCVSALVKLGDENAFPRLLDSLKSDSSATRIKAIKLIKDLKDKRAIDILKYKMNYDPSAAVQKAAKEALKAMDVSVEPDIDEKKKSEPVIDPKLKNNKKIKSADPKPEEPVEEVKKREDF